MIVQVAKIVDIYRRTHYVRKAHLDSDRTLIPLCDPVFGMTLDPGLCPGGCNRICRENIRRTLETLDVDCPIVQLEVTHVPQLVATEKGSPADQAGPQ